VPAHSQTTYQVMLVVLAGSSSPASSTPAIAAVSHLGLWLGHLTYMDTASAETKCLTLSQRYSMYMYTHDQGLSLQSCLGYYAAIADPTSSHHLRNAKQSNLTSRSNTMSSMSNRTSERSITINHDHETVKLKSQKVSVSKPQERHTDRPKHYFYETNDTFLRIYYPIPQVELLHIFHCSTLVVFDSSSPREYYLIPQDPDSTKTPDPRVLTWVMSGG
jgi:hypothetical protein